MAWFLLAIAGVLEVVWAYSMKLSSGFTKLTPSIVTLLAMAASFALLALSMRTLPLGTAYGVWVGIGAVGAAIAGMVLFKEPATMLRVVSLVLVVAGIVGLKLSSAA